MNGHTKSTRRNRPEWVSREDTITIVLRAVPSARAAKRMRAARPAHVVVPARGLTTPEATTAKRKRRSKRQRALSNRQWGAARPP
jgi:hypothetical protein